MIWGFASLRSKHDSDHDMMTPFLQKGENNFMESKTTSARHLLFVVAKLFLRLGEKQR